MTTTPPDFSNFQTLFNTLPTIYSLNYRLLHETANYNWLDAMRDITSEDAAKKIASTIPQEYTSLISKGNDLDTAIRTIEINAAKYPAQFSGKDTIFSSLISDLSQSYKALVGKSSDDVKKAVTNFDYSLTMPLFLAMRDFTTAIYQIEIFYYQAISGMKTGSYTCPQLDTMIGTAASIPTIFPMKWAFVYFLGAAQYTCLTGSRIPTEFYEKLSEYSVGLLSPNTKWSKAIAALDPSNFDYCYAASQTLLFNTAKQFKALQKKNINDYLLVRCSFQGDFPFWKYPTKKDPTADWDEFNAFQNNTVQALADYTGNCYAQRDECQGSFPGPLFTDMMKAFTYLIPFSGLFAGFSPLSTINYWIQTFQEANRPKAGSTFATIISELCNSQLTTSLHNIQTNKAELPKSVQSDVDKLLSYYNEIQAYTSLLGEEVIQKIPNITSSLENFVTTLSTIKANYMNAVFGGSSLKDTVPGVSPTITHAKCPMKEDIDILYSESVTFLPMIMFPSYVKNTVMPKIERLRYQDYTEDLKPIHATVEKISEIGRSITNTAANTFFFGLIFKVGTLIKGGLAIRKLIIELKELAIKLCREDRADS